MSSNYDDLFSLSRLPVEGAVRPEVLLARLVIASKTLPNPGESLPVRVQRLVRRVGTRSVSDVATTDAISSNRQKPSEA